MIGIQINQILLEKLKQKILKLKTILDPISIKLIYQKIIFRLKLKDNLRGQFMNKSLKFHKVKDTVKKSIIKEIRKILSLNSKII